MIILDTNVVSEPMRPNANPAVLAWLDQQAADTLFLTTISLVELLLGIAYLPNGKRKDGLKEPYPNGACKAGRIQSYHKR